jgi:sugar phosphate isomerase/epimerase
MLLSTTNRHPVHLAYCQNIHPAEGWPEAFAAIRTHATAVRRLAAPDGAPFGLGLRLGARAAAELEAPGLLAEFAKWLDGNGMYVFTVNGFPYGDFHGARVKEQVYAPDWRTPQRLAYTLRLGRILAALLPAGVEGSISTVPGSYGAWCRTPEDAASVRCGIAQAAAGLAELSERTGRTVRLALEPEPDCLLESGADMLDFWNGLFQPETMDRLAAAAARPSAALEKALRGHLGFCVDTCHLAVNFEDPPVVLRRLLAAGVPVPKVQVSAAPALELTPAGAARLEPLRDAVYLHQTRIRLPDGTLRRFPDLPSAAELAEFAGMRAGGCGLRTHFHVPLCWAGDEAVGTTRDGLGPAFFRLLAGGAVPHVELETYTFAVLPEAWRARSVEESLAAEYAWFLAGWRAV